jgi:hypothetical protein
MFPHLAFAAAAAISTAIGSVGDARSPPTAEQGRLLEVAANRPAVADGDNAWRYVLALPAPAGADLEAVSRSQIAWLEVVNRVGREKAGEDPLQDSPKPRDARSPGLSAITQACGTQKQAECIALLGSHSRAGWNAGDEQLLTRYRVVLMRNGWREMLPMRGDIHFAPYADLIDGQKLYFIRLLEDAQESDAAMLRAAFQADLRFWRMLQANADLLISKMIGVAGIRQHYFFVNEILRRLPREIQRHAIPDEWRHATNGAELSMWRVAAGEYAVAAGLAAAGRYGVEVTQEQPPEQVLRQIARNYVLFAREFETPLERFPTAAQGFKAKMAGDFADPSGYALRTGSIEALRQLALLVANMRIEGVPKAQVGKRLKSEAGRNPFTGQPYEWREAEGFVVFLGPGDRPSRERLFAY